MDWLTNGFLPEERERMFKRVKRGVEFLDKNNNRAMTRSERRKRDKRLQLTLKSRIVYHPLVISIFLVFLQQGSGNNVISTYTLEILEPGKGTVPVETATVIIGINYFLCVVVATMVVERLGRKPLLLTGTTLMFSMLVILGVFFYYLEDPNYATHVIQNYSWVPVLSVNVFIGGYAIGLGTVTWILATEINHPDFQEIAGTLDSLTYWLTAFTSMMTYPTLAKAIRPHWCFWLYAISTFVAFWYCFFFVYETKGRTQEEIMAHYRGHIFNLGGDEEESDDDDDSKSMGSILHQRGDGGDPRKSKLSDASDDTQQDLRTLYGYEVEVADATR